MKIAMTFKMTVELDAAAIATLMARLEASTPEELSLAVARSFDESFQDGLADDFNIDEPGVGPTTIELVSTDVVS